MSDITPKDINTLYKSQNTILSKSDDTELARNLMKLTNKLERRGLVDESYKVDYKVEFATHRYKFNDLEDVSSEFTTVKTSKDPTEYEIARAVGEKRGFASEEVFVRDFELVD